MSQSKALLDLDYDSPLETVFSFAGSPLYMGLTSLGTWFLMVSPGKNGAPPIWAEFPVVPFFVGMACIWAVGFWLKSNYDVRYQLDSRTQQLQLVRQIFGQTFKSRVAGFTDLHSTGVMSTYWDDKHGRHWQYAVGLITRSARIIRVSSYSPTMPTHKAAQIAENLGIPYFPGEEQVGTLRATRDRNGQVAIAYKLARTVRSTTIVLVFVIVVAFLLGLLAVSLMR